MGKKKKKNREIVYGSRNKDLKDKSKKEINAEFKHVLNEIESMQIALCEADKKANRKNRKKINKKESEIYDNFQAIKCRKKMAKKWKKTGFLDNLIELLQMVAPLVKILAKAVAVLIISFLSIDAIKSTIGGGTLHKLTKVFDIAMSV